MNETRTATELDELKDWLQHPGTTRFLAHAREEWGAEGYPRRLKQAIAAAREVGADLEHAVDRVDYANDEINRLLSWGQERVKQLQTAAKPLGRFFESRRI